MKLKFEDPHLTAVFNTPPNEQMPRRKKFREKAGKIRKDRDDLLSGYLRYCALAGGATTVFLSPFLMEEVQSAGGGDLKWIIPALGAAAIAYGSKIVRF